MCFLAKMLKNIGASMVSGVLDLFLPALDPLESNAAIESHSIIFSPTSDKVDLHKSWTLGDSPNNLLTEPSNSMISFEGESGCVELILRAATFTRESQVKGNLCRSTPCDKLFRTNFLGHKQGRGGTCSWSRPPLPTMVQDGLLGKLIDNRPFVFMIRGRLISCSERLRPQLWRLISPVNMSNIRGIDGSELAKDETSLMDGFPCN